MSDDACGRCGKSMHEHHRGDCPDGGGSYTFVASNEVLNWLRAHPDIPEGALLNAWIEHLRAKKNPS